MIPFNKPPLTGSEMRYIELSLGSGKLSGDGDFSRKCEKWFENKYLTCRTLLTPSCTAALEMAALLIDIEPDDEVIMPSYTFVSTANSFALRGAKIVFVDINPLTMNIDETLIEAAITDKTKAIVPVHYAGVACEMDTIMDIAQRYDLFVVEDAAQGVHADYKGRPLGTIGHFGAFSFHETKNYTSGGEGGLLLINDPQFSDKAEILREKGTNRSQFFRGQVDKYTWVSKGSSFLPSEIQSAYLMSQLEAYDIINEKRLKIWDLYYRELLDLAQKDELELPNVRNDSEHNAHMFYLKLRDIEQRDRFIQHMKERDVLCVFHYVPLHSSPAGKRYSVFSGEDKFTTVESERLVRLPLYYSLTLEEQNRIIEAIREFNFIE